MKGNKIVDQQKWIITFNSDANDADHQVNALEKTLLNAPSDIDVIRKPKNDGTQGGWIDLIVTLVTSGTAVAVVNAIATWIKSTHGASIDIEIEGITVKAINITSEDYETTLREVLKSAQGHPSEKKKLR